MSNFYYSRQAALSLIDRFDKDIKREPQELGDQLSVFHKQTLIDFIEWLYESESLEIVNRFL